MSSGNNQAPATMPPLVPVTTISSPASNAVPPRKTLQETIKDIESSILVLESKGSLNPRQDQDLAKLKELHTRALAEQERLKTNKVPQHQPQQQHQSGSSSSTSSSSSAKSPGVSSSSVSSPAASNSTPNTNTTSNTTTPAASTGMAPPSISSPSPSPRGGGLGAMASRPVDPNQMLNKKKLQDLVKEIDPNTQLDDDVEEMMLQVADDFIENIVTAGCQLAKHRKSGTLEVKDILLHLERNWNMMIPGYGMDDCRSFKRPASTEAHKQRMALIRKTLKK